MPARGLRPSPPSDDADDPAISTSSTRLFCELFLDHFRLLFCAHITQRYAQSLGAIKKYRGGLAPWQKRRVAELLEENLDGQVGLADLAAGVRAFRQPLRAILQTIVWNFGTPLPDPPANRKGKILTCQTLPPLSPRWHCKRVFLTKRPLAEPSTPSSEYLPVTGREGPDSYSRFPSLREHTSLGPGPQ